MANFVVNGKEYPAPTDFTLGEMCDAETYFGVDFGDPRETARDVAATLFVAIKRVDPTVTPDDIRAIPAKDLEEITRQVKAERAKAQKEADARPPASDEKTSESVEPSSNSSNGIGEQESDQIPAASGRRGSERKSASAPPTSAT